MLSKQGHTGKSLFQVTSYWQDSGLPVHSEEGSDQGTPIQLQ